MKNSTFLQQRFPRCHQRFATLPVFGGLVGVFLQWLDQRGYTRSSLRNHLSALRQLSRWLVRRHITSLAALDQQILSTAHKSFMRRKPHVGGPIHAMSRFLRQRGAIPEGHPAPSPATEVELARFGAYLREVHGLAGGTILAHQRRLRPFLRFIRMDQCPKALTTLTLNRIQTFLKRASRTNNRFSMQHVVASLRTFLKAKHAQRVIAQPLHQQIDTPWVYRLERLPRALPWSQVWALLLSIDRSEPGGWRDFTMLYLAAAYGLRSGELVRLTLEDIDWRGATLRVPQSKTGRSLQLPLTDEAAKVLIDYLRLARCDSTHRELFLRIYAPSGPLAATAVNDVLEKRARESGLKLPRLGSHVLRHSFALHLLRRRVPMKAIGDALGHRDPESTGIYLRLALEDLREVGLPVPKCVTPSFRLAPDGWQVPRVRVRSGVLRRSAGGFASRLNKALRSYIELKQAMGRCFAVETTTLLDWDRFLHRRFRRVCTVRAEMFYGWATRLGHLAPTVRRHRLRIVRNFLLFHARSHPGTFIPDPLTFPKAMPPRLPRLVSVPEMGRVLEVARQLRPSHFNPLRAQTARVAFILLFCCGLRRGDPSQLSVDQLSVERITAFLSQLESQRRNRASTRNVRLSAIHSFFRYLGSQSPEHLDQAQRILGVPFKRTGTREIQHLEFAEIQAVLEVIDRSRAPGRRDYALLSLMFNTGGRVSEIVALQACDLRLTSPPSVLLRGKGRKERVCPIWPQTATLMRAFLEERNLSPTQAATVFVNHRGTPLTRFGVRLILRKYIDKAIRRQPSLKAKRLHPHCLRHTTAVYLLRSGVDPSTIAHWLGHASVNTTNKYLTLDLEAKREALAKAKPLIPGARRSGKWRNDQDLLTWLEKL